MKMKSCSQENRIDDYLLERMDESERTRFEEHYFNCSACFRAVQERDLALRAVKTAGVPAFSAVRERPRRGAFGILRPWTAAVGGVCLLFVFGVLFGPGFFRKPTPWIPPIEDAVRGGAIAAIAPLGDAAATPAALEWRPVGEGVEYAVTLTGPDVEWSGRTRESRIALPDATRRALRSGAEYRWQVKAFAPQGFFTGTSGTQTFRIAR
jgi:hypothetical protein